MAIKRRIGIMALAAIACALAAHAETITIAAAVNEDVITSLDLAERRALVMANANIPNTPENIQRATPQVLQLLIDDTLKLQEAERLSIKISDEEVAKAVDSLGTPGAPPGAVKKQILDAGLSERALNNQIRAQLAWNKVVQRKLRRNVTITQDELARAQQLQTAAPGTEELRLAVLAVAIPGPDKVEETAALTKQIEAELASGRDMPAVAEKYRSKPNVQYNPLLWVTEERIPPELFAMLKEAKLGQLIGPVRSGNILQFVKLLERRVTKKAPSSTEVLLKQITLEVPAKSDKVQTAKLAESQQTLRNNPGNCDDTTLPSTPVPGHALFARVKLGTLSPEQQNLVSRLDVGSVSEPQITPGKLQLVMLCERSESQGAIVIDEGLRQQLFGEKMELEAQKHLRDLRREATLDIRGAQ